MPLLTLLMVLVASPSTGSIQIVCWPDIIAFTMWAGWVKKM
jgi:hypothetical protein